jgi:hypothetical protein
MPVLRLVDPRKFEQMKAQVGECSLFSHLG